MYEKLMLNPNDVENVVSNGVVEGINIKVRIPYYRGVCLSLVDDAVVKVRDEVFTKDQLTFTVGGETYYFEDMATITTVRWEFGEKATLFVPVINGLNEYGPTDIEVGIRIRVPYNPPKAPTFAHMTVDRSASGGNVR